MPHERRQYDRRQGDGRGNEKGIGVSVTSTIAEHIDVCPLCSHGHTLFGCSQFKGLKVEDRIKITRDNNLCYNSLRPGHYSAKCKLTRTCSVPGCDRKHTKFLHEAVNPSPVKQSNEDGQSVDHNVERTDKDATVSCNTTGAGIVTVALPIVPVRVRASNSPRYIDTYALLDSGSTSTFCSERLADELRVDGETQELTLMTLDKEDRRVSS